MAEEKRQIDRNVHFVRRLCDSLVEGDFAAVVCALDDSVVLRLPPGVNDSVVRQLLDPADVGSDDGSHTGLRAVRRVLVALRNAFEVDALEVHSFEGHRDRVVVSGHFDGWFRPNGQRFTTKWVHTVRLRRGKVWQLEVSGVPSHPTRESCVA